MRIGKYLKFHFECIKTGKLPDGKSGLCGCFNPYNSDRNKLNLFKPSFDEKYDLIYRGLPSTYWGRQDYKYHLSAYTPLRQTIVLFLAAMNNEL